MALAVLELKQVNQWFESTKFSVAENDIVDLEDTAKTKVFSALRSSYDVTSWTDKDSTPDLVRSIISMYVAGWVWQRQSTGAADKEGNYGQRLVDSAQELVEGLKEGLYDLDQEEQPRTNDGPSFFPNDAATQLAEDDPSDPNAAKRAFSMGQVF